MSTTIVPDCSLGSWDPSIVMRGSRVEIFQVITLARRPGERTKRETGQRSGGSRPSYKEGGGSHLDPEIKGVPRL